MATADVTPRGTDRMPALQHATVADVMRRGVISCSPETDLRAVARLMATHHIHSVVVSGIEADPVGERLTWGLISDLDVAGAAQDLYSSAVAGGLAGTELVLVEPQEPLVRAAQLMAEHQLAHLLVVSPKSGAPIGMVSTLDVAGCVAWGEG